MTICSKMYEALDKRLEEKKSLDEIGSELCDAVIDPRGKAIRLIKQSKGEKYLKDNAEWLGYQFQVPTEKVEKNSHLLEEEAIREDARSVGMQTGGFIRQEPSYENPSPLTMTSMQDKFEPEEVVYENVEECPMGKAKCPQSHDKCDHWYSGGCNHEFDVGCKSGACSMPSVQKPNAVCPHCNHSLIIDYENWKVIK